MPGATGGLPASAKARPERGFTLLELTLALAVLAVVIGMTWPALDRFVGDQHLREDSSRVRSSLASVRLKAIEAGLACQFRYEPHGRKFIILPHERPLQSGADPAAPDEAASAPAGLVEVLELAADHRFLSAPPDPLRNLGMQTPTERLSEDWLQLCGAPTSLAEVTWSTAIAFAPDGTAEDASFVIADEDGRYQVITLRGLTGGVAVGPVDREVRR